MVCFDTVCDCANTLCATAHANQQTSADAANVVALQEKIADARAELDMHQQNSNKRVNDLKHALALAEDAKNISKTSLERSQQKLKDREQSWSATEARLNSATEAAKIDAAKLKEKLQLTKDENLKQLKKLEREKNDVDEVVKEREITLGAITAKFDNQFKVLDAKLTSKKEELKRTQAELSRAIKNVEERKHELNETKSEIDTVRDDIEEVKDKKEVLATRLNSLEKKLAAEDAKNLELRNSVDDLKKDVAFKRESSTHFNSAEHSFRVIRAKVNETMAQLTKEREQALLVSQDLLKVA